MCNIIYRSPLFLLLGEYSTVKPIIVIITRDIKQTDKYPSRAVPLPVFGSTPKFLLFWLGGDGQIMAPSQQDTWHIYPHTAGIQERLVLNNSITKHQYILKEEFSPSQHTPCRTSPIMTDVQRRHFVGDVKLFTLKVWVFGCQQIKDSLFLHRIFLVQLSMVSEIGYVIIKTE